MPRWLFWRKLMFHFCLCKHSFSLVCSYIIIFLFTKFCFILYTGLKLLIVPVVPKWLLRIKQVHCHLACVIQWKLMNSLDTFFIPSVHIYMKDLPSCWGSYVFVLFFPKEKTEISNVIQEKLAFFTWTFVTILSWRGLIIIYGIPLP